MQAKRILSSIAIKRETLKKKKKPLFEHVNMPIVLGYRD